MVAKHTSEVVSATSQSVCISNSILMMRFDAVLSSLPRVRLRVQCSTLKKALYERSSDMVKIYNYIKSWHLINRNPHGGVYIGEVAQFLVQYI